MKTLIRDSALDDLEEIFRIRNHPLVAPHQYRIQPADSIEAWSARFRENPMGYQEDFMFMGGKAFAYYYPVVDGFLRETPTIHDEERDDRQAWILAKCIQNQFDSRDAAHVEHLKSRILELCEFVQSNIARFDSDPKEQRRIDAAWEELRSRLSG